MLNALFKPQTIAVYGASRDPRKLGHVLVSNIVSGGFTGTLVPINPNLSEIDGLKCYSTARDFDGTLDLALVAVPAPQVRDAVADAAIRGVRTVAVVSTGFKGSGPEGDRLEAELVAYCQDRGIRLLGPSCLGVINPHLSLNASVSAVNPRPGGIGFISQSGALCASFLDWIHGRHLGISKLVCIGNRADIDETDLIQHYAADPDTKVIVAYLENIAAGEEFLKIAEGAASLKPLVILKAGITEAGVQAAASHTGRTAEMNIAYGAAFRRSGVVRAQSYGELIDFAKTFAMAPLPAGDRVAIVSNAGGSGILAADAVERFGLTVAQLPAVDRARLALQADESGHPSPVHLLGEADPEHYAEVVRTLQASDAVDSILVVLTPQAMARPAETARAIAERATGVKPMLFSFMGGSRMMPGREELVAHGLPDFNTPERAARSLRALGEYAAWRRRPPRIVARFPVNRRRVERIIARHLRLGRTQLSELKSKEALAAYNFVVPPGHLAHSASEAVEAAQRLGFPVVLKVMSPDLGSKTEVGGVRLDLETSEAVRDFYDLMMLRVARAAPHAQIEGIYVEKQGYAGQEVVLGMTRDPQFGPMLMFGLGGIFVEVLKDVSFYLAPITADEAMEMLLGTRSFDLLRGAPGKSAVDLNAIAAGLQRISQLATDFPQIHTLDINPFIVGQVGIEPYVADAHITLKNGVKHHD